MHKLKKATKEIIKSVFLFEPKILITITYIPFLYLLGWIFSQPFLLIKLSKENLSLIGTVFTFLLFIFFIPTWFNFRWQIRNSWSLIGVNNKTILKNILSFSKGIIFALILITLLLIPIFQGDNLSWGAGLSRNTIINGFFLIFGVGFAEELVFRGWLLEELKNQFGIKIAIISQASAFGIIHIIVIINLWNISGAFLSLGLFLLGILCSMLRLKDEKSLWGAIGLHGGLVGIWFILNHGLIEISAETPDLFIGYLKTDTNPLSGIYGITLLIISCIFYFLKFKSQILKSIKDR